LQRCVFLKHCPDKGLLNNDEADDVGIWQQIGASRSQFIINTHNLFTFASLQKFNDS